MTSVPMTDTITDFPALPDEADRTVPDPGWQYQHARTIEEATNWLDLLENIQAEEPTIERKGHSHYLIRWRTNPRFPSRDC